MNLKKVNLNLLLALDVLLSERHVSHAALKLNITQSAMSNVLKQLRELFDDPLLIRSKSAMRLTAKAQHLITPLREIILNAEKLIFTESTFNPKTDNSEFVLSLSDYTSTLILPHLISDLSKSAPHVSVKVRPIVPLKDLQDFEQGFLHLAIGHYPDPPTSLIRQTLYTDSPTCFMNKKHPLAKVELTQERFLSCRHIVIAFREDYGGTVIEENLMRLGVNFKPIVRVPYALVACQIASQTDLVLIAGRNFMSQFTTHSLVAKKLPFNIELRTIAQYWHSQYDKVPAHLWLRKRIKHLTENIGSDYTHKLIN